jgi:hypothetical protein
MGKNLYESNTITTYFGGKFQEEQRKMEFLKYVDISE